MRMRFSAYSDYLLYIEVDKWEHFDASVLIAFVVTVLLKACGVKQPYSLLIGFTVGVIAGFAKEIWDKKSGESFDFADIKADVYGATAGALMGTI